MKKDNIINRFFFKNQIEEERKKYLTFKKLLGLYPEIHERVINSKQLPELIELHKKAYDAGFVNKNLSPCEWGMFRTNSIQTMEPKDVFLGNINGLWTHNVEYWETNKNEPIGSNGYGIPKDTKIYDIIVGQYRNHINSNINAIKNEANRFVAEYEEINNPINPFKLLCSK